jgi:phage-related baseplate assembly protein
MSRSSEYKFVDTDTDALVESLVSAYEAMTGRSAAPASPERLFISWIASIIVQERVLTNYAGNQNIPSRAEGPNLDAIAELFLEMTRPAAQPAVSTERFHISAAQSTAILIPQGTRVTDIGSTLIWETTEDAYVAIGDTYVDVPIKCQTDGEIGNGYAIGQINVFVDPYDYCDHVENTTESALGADEATDEEFYDLMVASMDGFSCAGAKGGYIYFAKQVSTDIKDVVANSPVDGEVRLYVLMKDGTIANATTKAAVLAACNADGVRPLTDLVKVEDPSYEDYSVNITYYIPSDSTQSAAEIQASVEAAVDEYIEWQSGKLGRDINPSRLIQMVISAGAKRVTVTSPAFTVLRDGSSFNTVAESVPQIARNTSKTITNGGTEDE